MRVIFGRWRAKSRVLVCIHPSHGHYWVPRRHNLWKKQYVFGSSSRAAGVTLLSASQPFLKWSFTNRDSKPFSLSINEALTCFYHPTWDYFLNITLNPSYSFKSFCFTSCIGYANNLEFFKSFMTFGFSVTKTLHNW